MQADRSDRLKVSFLLLVLASCGSLAACGSEPTRPVTVPAAHASPAAPLPCPRPLGEAQPVPAGAFDARQVIGLKEERAEALAQRHRCVLRVIVRDGRGGEATADMQLDRIDVYVNDGTVVGVDPDS